MLMLTQCMLGLADESVCIGSHQPQNSYLNISSIMSAVDLTGAEAIHPGYGFLSENAKFSEIVNKHGIKFIGPSAKIISKMGDKIEAKRIRKKIWIACYRRFRRWSKIFIRS